MVTSDLNNDLILYCTHNQLCATVDSQCFEYLGYITLLNVQLIYNDFGQKDKIEKEIYQ